MANKHALLVGINQYGKDSGLAPLRYAEDDARALAEALRRDCGFEAETLLGAAATGIEIQKRIKALSGGELFLFFFAGHGQMVQGQFCLHTAESMASGVGALPYEGLSRWWRYNFGFGQVLAVLDACRNEYNWASRGARGFAASRDIELSMAGESLVEVLYGCSDGEVSYEEEDLGHGVFTSALLRVLREDAGEVDSGTLAARANDLMAEWCRKSGKRQKAKRYYEPSEKNRIVLRPGAGEAKAAPGPAPEAAAASAPELLRCPLCGKYNPKADTFRCGQCGRDNLCLRHQDAKSYLCEACAKGRKAKAAFNPKQFLSAQGDMVRQTVEKIRKAKPTPTPKQREETRQPEQAAAGDKRGRFDVVRFILGLLLLPLGVLAFAVGADQWQTSVGGFYALASMGGGGGIFVTGCYWLFKAFRKSPPKRREETRKPEQAGAGEKRGRFDVVRFILGMLCLAFGGTLGGLGVGGLFMWGGTEEDALMGTICLFSGGLFLAGAYKYIRLAFKSP